MIILLTVATLKKKKSPVDSTTCVKWAYHMLIVLIIYIYTIGKRSVKDD